MIQTLTGKYRKHVAWLLFLVFYGDLAGNLYAGALRMESLNRNDVSFSYKTGFSFLFPPHVANKKQDAVNENGNNSITPSDKTKHEINNLNESPVDKREDGKGEIGGPGQPEMNTYKSVGVDNMVNLFTGDFSYNIPLLDIGGYPVNLFYNAGPTMDQEASWVGLGWNINPGTISRNMRGLPDDYNGQDSIIKEQAIKKDLTVGVNGSLGGELVGVPGLNLNVNGGIFYNNRRGVGIEAGAGFDYSPAKGIAATNKDDKTQKDTIQTLNISGSVNLNSQNGMSLNGGFAIYKANAEKYTRVGLSTGVSYSSRQGLTDLRIDAEVTKYKWQCNGVREVLVPTTGSGSTQVSSISFARPSYTPSIRMPLTKFNAFLSVKMGFEGKVFFGNGSIGGYLNETRLDKRDQKQKKPAYGYMYYEKSIRDRNALLDFNRVNDGVYTLKKPIIDLPVYTYDVFNISGEGTGGSFRGYRGNMGNVRDNDTRTKTGSFSLSVDLGGGDITHGGVIIGGVYSPAFVSEWTKGNTLRKAIEFKPSDGVYQGFYFKNPGEKAIIDEDYYQNVGADQLVRPYLKNIHTAVPLLASGFQVFDKDRNLEKTIGLTSENSYKIPRDKRTQVITCLNAKDASHVGLDKDIYSYKENVLSPGSCPSVNRTPIARYNPLVPSASYRKENHLSEIDIQESDGRRYVYGIPVYQVEQKEVSFSVSGVPTSDDQLVGYSASENSLDNSSGRDGSFERETIRGYAHSFLLTGILSPDYVDVTDDGITDDDLGTAIRFNYSRVDKKRLSLLNGNYWDNYKWRVPADVDKANFNEGLKADDRDNKGIYTYGVKELWYLHSIESKNMIAAFYVTDRHDGKPVFGEDGGVDKEANGQKLLKLINLYTKADYLNFLKTGKTPKPVKTVHFEYDYSSCPGFALNDGKGVYKNGDLITNPDDLNGPLDINKNKGKLTLKAIWFSYNGNDNQVKNKYVFKYAQKIVNNQNIDNPSYSPVENDRWGNYKPHVANPESSTGIHVGNNDFPYSIQNTSTNDYATAWNLEKILLPGGGMVTVQYEADDYAFVQNKRACQMTKIAGFGEDLTSTPGNLLYKHDLSNLTDPLDIPGWDYRYVFFDVDDEITGGAPEIKAKYLQDVDQLLMKIWVLMPAGNIGESPAYEPVIVYGAIDDYNVLESNHHRFWIKLKKTRRGGSPIMETVIQFMKDHLPHRAYPGYEVNGEGAGPVKQVVRAVFGMMHSFVDGVLGFERNLKAAGKCRQVNLNMSFARLNNPNYKKMGGGHRVKQIMIVDNWAKMTKKTDPTGMPDSYYGQIYDYTTTEIVNGIKKTISSGVASYEPGVGNEENPFREVLKYDEHQFLGPTDHSNVELPVAETFFPSPLVGYSRVTVRSIHNKDNKNIKSGIGLQQTDFYTSRDFPAFSDYTSFDEDSRHHHKPGILQRIFNFNKKDYLTLTQGFRVVLNDMNGKLKSQTSYAENDYQTPVNYTANYYRLTSVGNNKYTLDNEIPVIGGSDGKIYNKLVGRDVEVMNDFREHFSYTYAINIPVNAEFFSIGPGVMLLPTLFRMGFRDESLYRSATTLKVVNEYGILDSVVNIDKGSVVSTKNLVYDAESGDVLISRTNNSFDKPVYQFSYPGWWVNTGMEPAYKNIDVVYKGVLFRNGKIEENPQVDMNVFESGDEIYLDYDKPEGPSESAACIASGQYPPVLSPTTEYRIWAIDVAKDLRNTTKAFIFIDRYGNPVNAKNSRIRIIRSGKRNLTGASAGNIVSLAPPFRTISGQQQVIFDNDTKVINAAAAEFKERWRANDIFYAKDTTIYTTKLVQVHSVELKAIENEAHSYNEYHHYRGSNRLKFHNDVSPDYFLGRHQSFGHDNNHTWRRDRSWALFDITGIPSDAQIISAKLALYAHRERTVSALPIHNFFYVANHYNWDPHLRGRNAVNKFRLSRVLSPWPSNANDDAAWRQMYFAQGGTGYLYEKIEDIPDPTHNYAIDPYTSADNRIDITGLFKGMVRDYYDQSKQFASAIKLNMMNDNLEKADETRVCFYAIDAGNGHSATAPRITVKYYDCSEAAATSGETAACVTAVTGKFCFSVFSKKQMNPYVEGVLGNWRGWKSYVYYGARKEIDPHASTDIRKDGLIDNFETYWEFASDPASKLSRTNSTKWVWNAEITQYNRKGAELENHDPLGRYNAGIYGYQESLPVAVINNSRLRLSAFDGFEDYYYQDDPCEPYCKPEHRHFITGISTSMLVNDESHTGRYSAKVNTGETYSMNMYVSANDETYEPDIRIKIASTPVNQVISVHPQGTGLNGDFFNNINWTPPATVSSYPYYPYINITRNCRTTDGVPSGINCHDMTVRWEGFIQPITTGDYIISAGGARVNDYTKILIDEEPNNPSNQLTQACLATHVNGNTTEVTHTVHLSAGLLHHVIIEYRQLGGIGYTDLYWKVPGSNSFVHVPQNQLYRLESLANGSTETTTVNCVKPDTIQAINHHLIDSFNLVPGKKMVASVWIKKGGQDCKCTGYDLDIFIKNNSDNSTVATLKPKERVIEGWQQFEAVFTVPSGTDKIRLEFHAANDAPLYFDDLRFHPFNANMKSFVYDPVNLRLAAELDENNFASFYEYDDDGGLIRVKKETKAGVKTITETRSAVQKNIKTLE